MTPQLRFSEFTDEWQVKKLGSIGPVAMCKRILKDETTSAGDVPFYKIGTFGRAADAFINKTTFQKYKNKYSFPKKGDILISAAGTVGRLVVYDGLPAYFQDSNIVWIANDESKVSNKFLFWCYVNTNWKTEDTTIARLYNDNLRSISIKAPSKPEQEKIADFLTAVDERIAVGEKKLELLETYKRGVMQQIFSQKIRFKDENGNEYPEWEEKSFDSVFSSITTKPYQIQSTSYKNNGAYPVVDQGKNSIIGYSDDSKRLFNNVPVIVFGDHTTILKYIDFNFIIGADGTKLLKASHGDNLSYLYYYLEQNQIQQEGYKRHFSSLKQLKISLPSKEEQHKIATFLTALVDKITAEKSKLTAAKQFKKALLQRMFV